MSLPTDTVKKIIEANAIRNGDAVCGATVKGDYETMLVTINKAPVIDAMNNKYKDKFTGTDTYSS